MATLWWALLLTVGTQLGLLLSMYTWCPELRDPEFSAKLRKLHARLGEHPGRPLVVFLGSSRVAFGVRPTSVTAAWPEPPSPLVFNLAQMGAGPRLQSICLRRMLADGIRPSAVVLEYWPPFHACEGIMAEECRIDPARLSWQDLSLLCRHVDNPRAIRQHWWKANLSPIYARRVMYLSMLAPGMLPWNKRLDGNWSNMDPWGWQEFENKAPAEQGPGSGVGGLFAGVLNSPVTGHSEVETIYDEMIALCQKERIRVAILFMPESEPLREAYSDARWERAERSLQRFSSREVSVILARNWADDKLFTDGYHLDAAGADQVSRRLGREELWRLLESAPPSSSLHAVRRSGP